ncbi:homoserine dehydrogenase [Marinococcus luteus]|uniref:Homoserine dehydrogenase n=1 Tax=Marinococcus luteus TaxID=1122204 RepID=A0A1H2XKC7_9BACI|nr:homoserine dehydrogenase [Marinococcus luteus]SDW93267.1 homoserine dehydrogenase [Marinococcus luteus]
MEKIAVGMLGFGTVGAGVAQLLEEHKQELQHQVGADVFLKKALVRDLEKPRTGQVSLREDQLTLEADDVLRDPEIHTVIEVMGSVDQARKYITQALQQGKSVVTANKDLMALHGAELLKIAADNHSDLFYEASVAGGIPVLRGLTEGLASDRITKMMGIVNGTTNYVLTKMSQDDRPYQEVLLEAQELGFAESDPTADVEGLDAARKVAILANLGFSMNVELSDVTVEGITSITTDDLAYCRQMGYTLKLIGLAERKNGKVELAVQPMMLPNDHPLSSVQNEYNAVYIYGEAVGETMFYGPGAGALPTATAVVSDLVTSVRNMRLGVSGQHVGEPLNEKHIKPDNEVFSKYFLRLHVKDATGTFAALTSIFAEEDVSFERLVQWPVEGMVNTAEIVIITHTTSLDVYKRLQKALNSLDVVIDIKSSYRVEGGS